MLFVASLALFFPLVGTTQGLSASRFSLSDLQPGISLFHAAESGTSGLRFLQDTDVDQCSAELSEIAEDQNIQLEYEVFGQAVAEIWGNPDSMNCTATPTGPSCIVDFSSAEGSTEYLEACAGKNHHALVGSSQVTCLGSTGAQMIMQDRAFCLGRDCNVTSILEMFGEQLSVVCLEGEDYSISVTYQTIAFEDSATAADTDLSHSNLTTTNELDHEVMENSVPQLEPGHSFTPAPTEPPESTPHSSEGTEGSANDDAGEIQQVEIDVLFPSAAEYYRQQMERESSAIHHDAYPLLDAVIASFLPGFRWPRKQKTPVTVSLEEMEEAIRDCSDLPEKNEDLVSQLRRSIPEIITKATKKFSVDTGRILETSSEEFELGDNYYVKMRSASVACFVSTGGIGDESVPAAYASYVVAPLEDGTILDPMPFAHNVSMFIEADVMDGTSNGQTYFIPKRYCLEGLGSIGEEDGFAASWGMSMPGLTRLVGEGLIRGWAPKEEIDYSYTFLDSVPNLDPAFRHTRRVGLGPKETVLTSTLNRLGREISWADKIPNYDPEPNSDYEKDLVLSSYLDPTIEMIIYADTIVGKNYSCFDATSIPTATRCVQDTIQRVLNEADTGMTTTYDATLHAILGYTNMKEFSREWRHHMSVEKNEISDEEINERVEQEIYTMSDAELLKRMRPSTKFPVPYIFDRNIAMNQKSSGYPPLQAVPFARGAQQRYPSRAEEEALSQCDSSSYQLKYAAQSFLGSLLRRFNERQGEPMTNVSQWLIHPYNPDLYKPLSEENASVKFDPAGNLLPGNLTERKLGRTAKWVMVTPWYGTKDLQNLLERGQSATSVFSKVGTEVYEADNPCGGAATNSDMLLYCFSITLAGFGAITGILQAFHKCFHWWAVVIFGPRQVKNSNTSGRKRCGILPYEIQLIMLGTLIFAGLFAPIVIQTIEEFEIANYKLESASMELHFSALPYGDAMVHSINQATIVTLAEAETFCSNARPWTMFTILIVGSAISIIANAPNIARVVQAVRRWCGRGNSSLDDSDTSFSVFDEELTVLRPHTASEFDDSFVSVRDRLSRNGLSPSQRSFGRQPACRNLGGNIHGNIQSSTATLQGGQHAGPSNKDIVNQMNDLKAELEKIKQILGSASSSAGSK